MLLVKNWLPLGRFLEGKPNKRDGLVRRVTLKTKSVVLEHSIDKIVLLEAPRLHESSSTLLILMSSIDCDKSLSCSEIRGKEREKKAERVACGEAASRE